MSVLGTYLVDGQAGHVGLPGAPILNFSLVVEAASGKVSGHAVIHQAIAPPYGVKNINNVTGQIRYTGYGQYTKVVALKGTYNEPFPPPAIGFSEVPFEAHFSINEDWIGNGGFSCGQLDVNDVPVTNLKSTEKPWSGPVVLYGVTMQEAAASGDLNKMKAVAKQAEDHLNRAGDITSALSDLKKEIKKMEK